MNLQGDEFTTKEHYGQIESRYQNWKNLTKCLGVKVISIILKTSFAANCKSKYCFYLRMFFDLIDVAIVNIHILYSKLGNYISLLNLKIVMSKALIGRYSNRKKFFPTSRQSKWKSHDLSMPREVPTHMLEFREK